MRERLLDPERKRRRKQEGVLDDKINGKVLSLSHEFDSIKHRVENSERAIGKNTLELKALVLSISEIDKTDKTRSDKLLDADKAKKIEKKIHKAMEKTLGSVKSKHVSKKFVLEAKEYGINKAADNMVHEIVGFSKRHSSRKIGAFARKTGEISRKTRVSMDGVKKETRREDKVEKKSEQTKTKAKIKLSARDGAILAATISKLKSKQGSKAVEARLEKLKEKSNESLESRLEKAVEKQVRLSDVRDMGVRRLRRTARQLSSMTRNIREVDIANNGIHLSPEGLEAAKNVRNAINNMQYFANASEYVSNQQVSSSKVDSQTMMIDAILQKGRASMMAASRRANVMSRSLVKDRQLDQERVRS